MKRLFLSIFATLALTASAMAADLPSVITRTQASIVAPSWAGFYLGGDLGGAWGSASTTDTNGGVNPGPFGYSTSGFVGGAHAGYNLVWNGFVFGPEIGVGYLDATGKSTIGSASAAAHQDLTTSGGLYVDLTARVGYSYGNWLGYAKGGYSYYDGKANQQTTNLGYTPTAATFSNGYVVGGGVEYMFNQNWILGVEYLHRDYGSASGYQTNASDPSSPDGYRFLHSTSYRVDSVVGRIGYKF